MKAYLQIAVLFSSMSFGQWTNDHSVNIQVTESETFSPKSFVTNDGKTYVVYWESLSGKITYKYQMLDKEGKLLYEPAGKVINDAALMGTSTLTNDQAVDAAGNLYVSFTETGNNPASGHKLNGYVHKISPSGNQQWGNAGIMLGQMAYDTKVSPTSDGGAYVGWLNQGTGRANLIKVNANGTLSWPSTLVIESGTSNKFTSVGEMATLSDGSVIVFYHARSAATTTYSTMWAQRYSADGQAMWSNPVQISNISANSNRRYSLIKDNDTIYLGVYANYGGGFNSYLQRINADGTLPWGINGTDFALGNSFFEMETSISQEKNSPYIWSLVVTANSLQSIFGISIQKFDKVTGERLLTDNAKEIFPITSDKYIYQGNLKLVEDKPLFLLTKGLNTSTDLPILISQLDEKGDFIWDEKFKTIASRPTAKTSVSLNYEKEAIAVWLEKKDGQSVTFAQNFTPDTTILGLNDEKTNTINIFPNPVEDVLNIETQQKIENLSLYTLEGVLLTSKNVLKDNRINISHLKTGVYILKLKLLNSKTKTFKVIKK